MKVSDAGSTLLPLRNASEAQLLLSGLGFVFQKDIEELKKQGDQISAEGDKKVPVEKKRTYMYGSPHK